MRSAYLSEVFGAGSLVGQRSTFANWVTLSAREKRGQIATFAIPSGRLYRELWVNQTRDLGSKLLDTYIDDGLP